jgi:hypothetical protein
MIELPFIKMSFCLQLKKKTVYSFCYRSVALCLRSVVEYGVATFFRFVSLVKKQSEGSVKKYLRGDKDVIRCNFYNSAFPDVVICIGKDDYSI